MKRLQELELPALLAGEQALFVEGDLRTAQRWFDEAYDEAARHGDGPAMARAALGSAGLWAHEHRRAADSAKMRIRQLDALELIDPLSTPALRLRIRLAAEEDFRTGGHAEILAMVAEARRAGDPVPLAEALSLAHHCLLGPGHGTLRVELARELIGVASKTDRPTDLLMGLLWLSIDLLLSADPMAGRQLTELRALLAQDDCLAVGYVLSTIEVMLAIRAGRLEQAESLAASCQERGDTAGVITSGNHAAQLGLIRWYQGRVTELVPLLADLVNSPALSVLDNAGAAGLAVAAATAGDLRLATSLVARLRPRILADMPRSGSWLMSMASLVEAAHLLADSETAARAYPLLVPFAKLPAMLSISVACLGSVHQCLGVASLTVGAADRAVEHLRAAIDDNLALGHWPAVVLSRFRLGQALALRDGHRDAAARRELTLAGEEAAALGMVLPADGRLDEREALVGCRRRGGQWQVEFRGRSVLVNHCVGLRHLAHLLANPGLEISALDLTAGPGTELARSPGTSAQPLLDDLAKRDYQRRLSELEAEIDELEAANQFDRAAATSAERDWLIAELAAAAGLAGRPRHFAGDEELARIAVGKAIRRALHRLADADPVIGAELRATVQTGLNCCYRPR